MGLVVQATHRDSIARAPEEGVLECLTERAEMRFAGKWDGTCSREPFSIAREEERREVYRVETEALKKLRNLRGTDPSSATQIDGSGSMQTTENTLLQIGTPAVAPLIVALKDKHWKVREVAAEALGKLHDDRAAVPLAIALGDEATGVRQAAAEALGRLKDARAVDPLLAALGDENGGVRKAAAEALGKLEDTRAVCLLINALGDRDSGVRRAAAEALDWLHWEPEDDTTAAVYWIAKQDWDECVALGTPAVMPLIAFLGDGDTGIREATAETLGKLNTPRALEPLISTLLDTYSQVRRAAAQALDKLAWEPPTEDQKVAYWIAKEDWGKCAAVGEPAIQPLINLIDPLTPLQPPQHACHQIRRALSENFGSHPLVIEALERHSIILIADDEQEVLQVIGFTLRLAGFNVVQAIDGYEAIEKAVLEQPDLISLDVRMPGLNGYEVCRRLKHNPATSSIPVVFLSAKGQESEIAQGLEAGGIEYLVKPFAPDELTLKIKHWLRGCRLGIY